MKRPGLVDADFVWPSDVREQKRRKKVARDKERQAAARASAEAADGGPAEGVLIGDVAVAAMSELAGVEAVGSAKGMPRLGRARVAEVEDEGPRQLECRVDGPTLDAFLDDYNFVTILRGPWGSGKSVTCILKLFEIACRQRPDRGGMRRTRWAVVRNCFDDRTEILTEARGWQLFRNLVPEDRVATLQDGARLVFERPGYYYAAHHTGEMIGLHSQGIDMLVTPDHHLWTSKRQARQRKWAAHSHEKARAAYGRTLRRFKRDADWDGGTARYSADFYEFLGFWFAEGTAGAYRYSDRKEPHWRFVVVQKEVGYVRDLLKRAGVRWGETKSKTSGCTYFRVKVSADLRPLVAELAALGGARNKGVPLWMKDCPTAHARAFITGYLEGDGHIRTGSNDTTEAFTASRQLADDLQEIALRAGMVVNVAPRKIGRGPKSFKSNGNGFGLTFLTPARSSPVARGGWYKQPYDGMVYCVEVSSHVVYVRRGGKAHWSGQTYAELRDTTIKTWLDWFPEDLYGPMVKSRPFTHVIRVPGDLDAKGRPTKVEIEVIFVALDDDNDRKKLLSLELTGAWVNEAREIIKPIIDDIIGRTGRYPSKRDGGHTWSGVLMDTNAPPETHWLPIMMGESAAPEDMSEEDRAGLVRPENWTYYVQPGALLPVLDDRGKAVDFRPNLVAENIRNLTDGFDYYMQRKGGKPRSWVLVNFCNELGHLLSGKPVWVSFDKDKHVAKKPMAYDPGFPLLVGVDSTGRSPAAVFAQFIHGRWRVLGELIGRDLTSEKFAPQIKAKIAQIVARAGQSYADATVQCYRDPHQQKSDNDDRTTTQVYMKHGIRLIPAPGGNGIAHRIAVVETAFDNDHIEIAAGCGILIAACSGGYRYRKLHIAGIDAYDEVPDKRNGYADVADALQYVLLGGGAGRLLVSGDKARPKPVKVATRYRPGEGREDLWARRRVMA